MRKPLYLIVIVLLLTACGMKPAAHLNNNHKNMLSSQKQFTKIRRPAVAGQFYPASSLELGENLEKLLAGDQLSLPRPRALLVPHAGYIFSGKVAAAAYRQLVGRNYQTVFLVGNSHFAYFSGIAIDANQAWETPLGQVEIDLAKAKKLTEISNAITFNSEVHSRDHSLEVQLPFLQKVLGKNFKIVPILVGALNRAEDILAPALEETIGPDDLVVISSDMSHYPSYENAKQIDQRTLEIIISKNIAQLENHIQTTMMAEIEGEETLLCGLDGVKTLMRLAQQKEWRGQILKYANSGDTGLGEKNKVVGYGAVVFYAAENNDKTEEATEELNRLQQKQLLEIAKTAVESYVTAQIIPQFTIQDKRLNKRQGAFVTLKKQNQLRGCIGQIIPSQNPLWQVVRDMAIAAATEDPRFSPVNISELPKLEYEISVLSPPVKITNWQQIELGKHGVIIQRGWQQGVFLPQVAEETGWSLEEFLAQLCSQKAGLAPDCYKNDPKVEFKIFTAQVFSS